MQSKQHYNCALFQDSRSVKRVGMFYGECSEICGANHSFMPIKMMVMPRKEFLNSWI